MDIIDIQPSLIALKRVNDEQLRSEIQKLGLTIDPIKFRQAFSFYGMSRWLSGLGLEQLSINAPPIPASELQNIRWRNVFFLRTYSTLIYMRSETLESGLSNVSEDSCLRPFRNFFQLGKLTELSVVQHIRNSLAHGGFILDDSNRYVTFTDREWKKTFLCKDIADELCDQVYRFYDAAYTAFKT